MKIEIVNYEMGQNDGILSKFAHKINEELIKLGQDSSIVQMPTGKADLCHHINYLPYKHERSPNSLNSLMITHIFEGYKLDAIKKGMETADMGICMSKDEMEKLISWGLPAEKLTYILPAHDGKRRRHQVVAILTNVYPDGCKRAEMFKELIKTLDFNKWVFRIMGSGWHEMLVPLVVDGLQVDLFNDFNYEVHQQILESSDYALYFGKDEGSMGILDAVNAGLRTIAPAVGFDKEIVDYPFDTQEELNEVFRKLTINKVEDWTWPKHAFEHISIWQKLSKV